MSQDPTTAHPQPGFPQQRQDPPGRVNAMDPAPDHGEHSYKGSGRLSGRAAIITGADWVSAVRSPSPSRGRGRTC